MNNSGHEKENKRADGQNQFMREIERALTQPTVLLLSGALRYLRAGIEQWLPEYCGPATAMVQIPLEFNNEWA